MVAKKTKIDEIKEALAKGKIVIGSNEAVKKIKLGKVAKVFASNNCPKGVQSDLEKYSKVEEIEFVVLDKDSDELGIICKKPFSISVLSILGEAKKK